MFLVHAGAECLRDVACAPAQPVRRSAHVSASMVDFFFFFKQKTAYEMVSCDWSSDVCSSDLEVALVRIFAPGREENTVTTVEDNLDECTLCDLCMQAAPDGVKVVKLYES